jgi:phage-related protein
MVKSPYRNGAVTKPVSWIGSSYRDFQAFPDAVKDSMGYALYRAQIGKMHDGAKPMKGFGGVGVVELVEDFRTDTYRAVYTTKFADVVYVLHAFQKKAKKGSATPKREIDLVQRRMKSAEADYRLRMENDDGS